MTAVDNMRESIRRQIMWNRLTAVVEEGAQVLLKTAFGAVTREAGDLSVGAYDRRGRMVAQAVTGTPGHVNTMATAVEHFLAHFPVDSMNPGDVYVTNDPWQGTGHLFDFVVLTPVFGGDRVVAMVASTCHVIDIGGRGFTADANSVFEEGLWVPHLPLFESGRLNQTLISLIERNVREPLQVRGDLMSLVSCNAASARRLTAMLAEFALPDIEALSDYIIETSRESMRAALRELPQGRWQHTMRLDGYDEPIDLVATATLHDGHLTIDFTGTSPVSARGINSPKCYSDAYVGFGVKCVVAPDIPNNAGSLSAVVVTAPSDTIVNPLPPAAVTARHVVGQMLPDLVFGCLAEAVGGRVPAEGAGSIWVLAMSGGSGEKAFNVMSIAIGGAGARPSLDGLSCTAFPSGVGTIPVEVTEAASPLLFCRREIAPGSAGAGRYRGGYAPVIEIRHRHDEPFRISAATFDRRQHPARGRSGGANGSVGICMLSDERVLHGKGVHVVPKGESLIVRAPGGGGWGDPKDRDPVALLAEMRDGLLGREEAQRHYAAFFMRQP